MSSGMKNEIYAECEPLQPSKAALPKHVVQPMEVDEAGLDAAAHPSVEERGTWAGKADFFLSLLGYSVGVSAVWRFPYLVYKNGGGAFLIPYWICMFICGIPLFLMEVAVGQFTSRSAVSMWSICPLFKGAGMATIIVNVIVVCYMNVLTSYIIFYFIQSFAWELPWSSCANWWNTPDCFDYNNRTIVEMYQNFSRWQENSSFADGEIYSPLFLNRNFTSPSEEYFMNRVLKISKGFDQPGGMVWELAACLIPAWTITGLCLIRGVKSVGKVVYFTATFPYVILTILLVRGVTLPGAAIGIEFYLKPDFSKMLDPQVWADAAFQVFFTVGPGWGGLVTMGSYNPFKNNCLVDSITVPIAVGLSAVYAGFVVFSVIGFMSEALGRKVSEVVQQGPGLAFVMYPEIVTKLPLAQFWSALFFFNLFIITLDSVFVMIETAITAAWDELPIKYRIKRHWLLLICCIVCCSVGLIFCTQGGIYVLHLVDTYTAFYTVTIVCLIEIGAIGWIYGAENFLKDVEFMLGFRLHVIWAVIWRFITSTFVLLILILSLAQYSATLKYGNYEYPSWAILVGWFFSSLSFTLIPIWIGLQIFRAPGEGFCQKLKSTLTPSKEWGPASPAVHVEWLTVFKSREKISFSSAMSSLCRRKKRSENFSS